MGRITLKRLRDEIIAAKGMQRAKGKKLITATISEDKLIYTRAMWKAELTLGSDLRIALFSKSDSTMAKKLNVSKSTICRWRKRIMIGRDR